MDTFGRLSITAAALMVFSAIFIVVCFIFLVWPWYRAQRQPRRLLSIRAELDALDALDPPTVLPEWRFDESIAPDGTVTYCPQCYLLVRVVDGWQVEPKGAQQFCPEHAYSTLARALTREESTR